MSEKEQIISLLYELATPQKMSSFFVNNATSDFLLIRPSRNPINAKGFEEMMNSGDVVQEKSEIKKIVNLLEQKSDEKYRKGDFKGAIRALRRSEKYLLN